MKQTAEVRYAYRHLELALAAVFYVQMKDLPAFRARLRHLRNLGVPKVDNPGSGRKITYSRDDAIHLLVALEGEILGLPPAFAAAFSRSAGNDLVRKADRAASAGHRLFVSVDPRFAFDLNDAWISSGQPGPSPTPVANEVHRRTVIDIAHSIRLLDRHLADAISKKDPARLVKDEGRRSNRQK